MGSREGTADQAAERAEEAIGQDEGSEQKRKDTDNTGVSDSTRWVKARQESEVQKSSHKESESARRKESTWFANSLRTC